MAEGDDGATTKSSSLPPLTNGVPPWHSTAFVTLLAAITVPCLPSLQSLDEVATVELFTKRCFPHLISLRTLAIVRLVIAMSALGLTVHLILGRGWDVYAHYRPQSKLRRRHIQLRGFGTLCPFTAWCWLLLGLSFTFNGSIAWAADTGRVDLIEPWMLRTALILWELSAPFALLVSSVIRYAIWPAVLAGGKPHKLACFRNQMQHNCNTIFSLTEVSLLGGIPVQLSHLSLAMAFGALYIVFTWFMGAWYYPQNRTEDGPQYLYWFMDTTLERTTTISLLALLVALIASFGVFVGVNVLIEAVEGTVIAHSIFVIVLTSLTCRFS